MIHPSVSMVKAIEMPPLKPLEPLEAVYINKLRPIGTYGNTYAPGNCTWYVASRLPVPGNLGNANTWDDRAVGYEVSSVPKVGAVAQSDSDSYLGHVAIVEAVNGPVVTISEMNYAGLGIVDTRIANPGEFKYIYV